VLAESAAERLGSDGLAVSAAAEQRPGIADELLVVGAGRGGVALRADDCGDFRGQQDRGGVDPQEGVPAVVVEYPRILAGAVIAAALAAVRRWSAADPPVPLGPLLRRALEQLATACSRMPADE
jgi:MftR C-terminal domain